MQKVVRGEPDHCAERRNVPTMSQVRSSIQYICYRKASGSNMGAPNFLRAPGAIQPRYAPASSPLTAHGPKTFVLFHSGLPMTR